MKTTLTKLNKIKRNPNNPRVIADEKLNKLIKSIVDFPRMLEIRPIVVNDDMVVLGGNMRLKACKEAGLKEVHVIKASDLTEEEQREFIIKDNVGFGDWDWELLQDEWDSELLDKWGLDAEFETEDEDNEGLTDEDDVPEVTENPISKLGDVWLLGEHRVMCGDSTKMDDVERLMDGNKMDITFTSPPYNIGISTLDTHIVAGKKSKADYKYANNTDDLSTQEYKTFLNDYTTTALMVSDYVFSNIQSLAGNKVALIEHLYDMRDKFADTIIWNKKSAAPAMERKVLNSQFEYIHVFSNESNRKIGVRDFKGTLFNVIEMTSRKDKELAAIHRATFPVEFAEHFVANFTEATCFDPFGGTGTTLIACEKKHRKCYMMELDPKYVDVIVKRWQEYTGESAIHADTGDIFAKLKNVA